MPWKRFVAVTAVLWFAVCVGSAQVVPVRPVASGFMGRLRASGQAYIKPNLLLGRETLLVGSQSKVGLYKPAFKEQLKCKVYQLCAPHFSPARMEKLLERKVLQIPFPAYYMNFPRQWAKFEEKYHGTLGSLEVILEAAYGEETAFSGAFVPAYRDVLEIFRHGGETQTAGCALEQAYQQAMEQKAGFFVITVHATPEHGYDVLLLDINNIQFISVVHSVGEVDGNN